MTKEYRQVGSYCWKLRFVGGGVVLLTFPVVGGFGSSLVEAVCNFTEQFEHEQDDQFIKLIDAHPGESLTLESLTCLGSFIEEREILDPIQAGSYLDYNSIPD
jgi:hypothetical protein